MSSASNASAVRRRSAAIHSGILGIYTLLTLMLTWPLLAHFTTHVPGDGIDDPSLAWNLWWMRTRLVDQLNFDIFHVDWMFHPVEINLAFYTLTPLNGLLSIPLQLTFDLILASNVVLLSTFVLGGYGVFLLVRWLLVHHCQVSIDNCQLFWPAALAGIIYAFASSKLFYASLGQFNIASSHWIPFYVLYLLRMGESATLRAGLRNAFLAGLFLTFQAWAELTYASFLLIFSAVYAIWWVLTHRTWHTEANFTGDRRPETRDRSQHRWWHLWRPLRELLVVGRSSYQTFFLSVFVLALLFLLGIAPFLWAMLPDMAVEGDFFASGGGFADLFSADLLGYLLPTRLHPIWGAAIAPMPFPNDKGQHIYVGYTALALVGVGVVGLLRSAQTQRRRIGWFWLTSGLLFWLLTLGPHVRWAGQPLPIPGPFALISQLPFFSGNRYPSRYSVMLMLCVAVLAGFGVQYCVLCIAHRWRRRITPDPRSAHAPRLTLALVSFCALLFLFEHLSAPLPLNNSTTPPIYRQLTAAPEDAVLLELPTGWRNGARVLGFSDELIMMQQWYQSVHERRRLGGNTSRNPPYKFQYFTEAPLLGDLIALMNAEQDHMAPVIQEQLEDIIHRNRTIAPQVLDFLNVRYVTVHVRNHGAAAPAALLRFVDEALPLTQIDAWRGPDWTGQASTIRLYRVDMGTRRAQAWQLNLADPFAKLHLAAGWSALAGDGVRYATRPNAALLLDLPDTGGTLELELFGPAPGMEIWLAGQLLTAVPLDDTDDGQRVTVDVPGALAREPVDRLTLRFAGPLTPVNALGAASPAQGWPVGETGISGTANLVVRSAGLDVGDFAHIYLHGEDVAQNARGYNLVALDAQGNLLESVAFDTLVSASAAAEMARWLRSWPAGTLIAGAVRDSVDVDADGFRNLSAEAIDALRDVGVASDLRGKQRWSHAFIGAVDAPPGSAVEQADLLRPTAAVVGVPVTGSAVSGGVGAVRFTPRNVE